MPFNITEIASELSGNGLLRDNKYLCYFMAPNSMMGNQAGGGGINQRMQFYTKACQIPGVEVECAPIRRFGYGPNEQKPFAPNFKEAVVTFYVDGGGEVWKYLTEWQRSVINYNAPQGMTGGGGGAGGLLGGLFGGGPALPYELNYKYDYCTDIILQMFNDIGEVPIQVVLRQAYPIAVTGMDLMWEAKNQMATVSALFTYMDWYQPELQ